MASVRLYLAHLFAELPELRHHQPPSLAALVGVAPVNR
jgi:hypothetical protein